ncbi:MAG: hypothetical protein HXS46_08415 [Theionarchaea archaeon]|nr:MAG: hypothetical protein AYK18_05875 [Theionarchaea archaeon DG-70]MBU7010700.1 hypothetical protein [Theionarchaea archaeon]
MPHKCGECIHFVDREDSLYPRKDVKYCEVHDAYYLENHVQCEYFESGEEKKSLINRIWK